MGRLLDLGQSGPDTQFLHPTAKSIRAGAGIVLFAGNEPAERILLPGVVQR